MDKPAAPQSANASAAASAAASKAAKANPRAATPRSTHNTATASHPNNDATTTLDQSNTSVMDDLYRAAVGSINSDYYLKVFTRFDALDRAALSWNWAAGLSTLNWMVFRKLWGAALGYLGAVCGASLLVFGIGRLLFGFSPTVQWALLAGLLALTVILPGVLGNAMVYSDYRKRIEQAVANHATLAEAASALKRRASSRGGLVTLGTANALLVGMVLLVYFAMPDPKSLTAKVIAQAQASKMAQGRVVEAASATSPTASAPIPAPSTAASPTASTAPAASAPLGAAPVTSAAATPSTSAPAIAASNSAPATAATATATAITAPATHTGAASAPAQASSATSPSTTEAPKNTSPSNMARGTVLGSTTPAVPPATSAGATPKTAKEPTAKEATPKAPTASTTSTPAAKTNAGSATTAAATKAPTGKTTNTPPASSAGQSSLSQDANYLVNVGMFADENNVRNVYAKLTDLGLKVFSNEIATKKGKLTRLRVGPFATQAEAERSAEAIKRAGMDAQVVKR